MYGDWTGGSGEVSEKSMNREDQTRGGLERPSEKGINLVPSNISSVSHRAWGGGNGHYEA